MKLLTLNFLTCAVKQCKTSPTSFPLHMKDCVLEQVEVSFQPAFMRNIVPRISFDAMRSVCDELGLGALMPRQDEVERLLERQLDSTTRTAGAEEMEEGDRDGEKMDVTTTTTATTTTTTDEESTEKRDEQDDDEVLHKLHKLLVETTIDEGKLVCGNCGFEYPVKEGVGNFLLPAHLV